MAEAEDVPALPRWVSCGVAESLVRTGREADKESVLKRWYAGCLPPVAALLRMDGSPADRDSAVAGMLIAWLKQGEGNGAFFKEFFIKAVEDGSFSVESLFPLLSYGDDISALEHSWDAWLLSRRRSVVTPGVTRDERIVRFRTQRLISAVDSAISGGRMRAGQYMDPSALLDAPDLPWIRAVAGQKAFSLRISAIGRSKNFEEMVGAHCDFLKAVKNGLSAVKCERLLHRAEALYIAIEAGLPDDVVMDSRQAEE